MDQSARKAVILEIMDDMLTEGAELKAIDIQNRLLDLGFRRDEISQVLVDQVAHGWYNLDGGMRVIRAPRKEDRPQGRDGVTH